MVRHTEPGTVVGTPLYMSPEQAGGELNVDARSDIFSLGIILYEMLTGINPFNATSAREIMHRVRTVDPPPVRSLNPGVPIELAGIVQRAMEKDVTGRFQAAADLVDQLEAFLHPGVQPPVPHSWVAGLRRRLRRAFLESAPPRWSRGRDNLGGTATLQSTCGSGWTGTTEPQEEPVDGHHHLPLV